MAPRPPHLGVTTENSRDQTFWEFATFLLAAVLWFDDFVVDSILVLGDNTAALSNALALKGRGPLLSIARELSWKTAKRG